MNLKIEYIDKKNLKPYANNAKIHTAEQIEQIKNSIREFGFNDPIAVWKDNEIIEGHGRLLAVMEMDDIATVPVIRLDGLTDEQRKAYTIAHNKLTMNTDFNLDILSLELEDIGTLDMTNFGFNEAEILELTIDDSPEEIPSLGKAPEGVMMPSEGAVQANYPPEALQNGTEAAYQPTPVIPTGGEPLTKEELSMYSERAEQMVTRRVIIVYRTDEEESYLRQILREAPDKPLGVIYDAKNILKSFEKADEENGSEESAD